MFDITQFAMQDSASVHLVHPVNGTLLYADEAETLPVTVTVYSKASKQYRKVVDAMMKKNERIAQQKKKLTPEEVRESQIDFLVSLSITSENMAFNGSPVDNEDVFRAMYTDERFSWVRSQVDEFLSDNASFFLAD